MKKLLFLTAIAVFGFNNAIAQEDTNTSSGVDISFGIKAGGNVSNTSNSKEISDDGTDNRYGFNVGAVVNIGLSEKFSIQSEVVYSQQGFTTSSDFDLDIFDIGDIVWRFDYINIPVMASYEVVKGLTIQAGPQVGFNINAEVYNSDIDLGDDFDLSESTNTVDFGAGLGAQYELDFGLFFQARYVWGFSNYIDSNDADGETYSNRVGNISVGYFFN
jgi:opacity protein-like surface antigen